MADNSTSEWSQITLANDKHFPVFDQSWLKYFKASEQYKGENQHQNIAHLWVCY